MFYQDNNDYMRDSFYYGNGMNSTNSYNNNMMYGNMQNPYMQNNYQMPMQNPVNSLNNMYPQIYRIINPVINRVISNSNHQYMTEDNLNNMVDTVYNIVEGDVSSLMNTQSNSNSAQGDDTVSSATQNNTRGAQNTSNSTNERRGNSTTMDHQANNNGLLRDLIKILLIKELLSRQNNHSNFSQNQGMPMNYYNPMSYGML